MILISHRGNTNGRMPSRENEPEYIDLAIISGFDVEIDIWLIDGSLWLGHDKGIWSVSLEWLTKRKDSLWIHCKNVEVFLYFFTLPTRFNFFWHEGDTLNMTSFGFIWALCGKQPIKDSIAVLPEIYNEDVSGCSGICSDVISKYRK